MPPNDIGSLARDLSFVAFGSVLLAGGLAALLLPTIHRPARTLSLTSFGAAAFLYGLRIMAGLLSVRSAVGVPDVVWDYTETTCTYLLPVVTLVFTEHSWGAGWRSSIRRAWQINLTYATAAMAVDFVSGTPGAAIAPNGPLVIASMAVVVLNVLGGQFHFRPEDRFVRGGLILLVVLIVNDNLVGLGLVPWGFRIEALGIVIFVGLLGYALALRTFRNERRLATLDYELRTARRIQQSLLPRERPRTPGGALAVRYRPMAAVGGDLYDYLHVDRDRLGILVADVTGHGIPAALIASMVKTAAASQTRVADRPAEVLAGINGHLCGQVDGHYVTAVYVYLDLTTGRSCMANAGHPAPMVYSGRHRAVRQVGDSGLMLGFLPDAEYPTTELSMTAGDRLVLYTDGVVEATSPAGEFFDPGRLSETLITQAELSAERWADHLLSELTRWSGKTELQLDDDLTLLVLDIPSIPSRDPQEVRNPR